MNFDRLLPDSLRHKIIYGYGAVAVLVIGLSAFSLIEMRLLAEQISAGERIHRFLGIALEIRRFEKNFFLYHQPTDLLENRSYVAQARQMLDDDMAVFAAFENPAHLRTLVAVLDEYDQLIAGHAPDSNDPALEARIRQAGKTIVTAAEDWSRAERTILQGQLDHHRNWLIAAIGGIVVLVFGVGQLLAWRIARPLKELEQAMDDVAAGRLARLDMTAQDREIAALTHAFNHVLQQLETRQGQLLRSEKLAALGTLLSGVAHELNNPLSNISTSCEILNEEVDAGKTAFVAELLSQIDTETWRARRIVRSLLDYARDREFRRETVPLARLVDDSLRLLKAQVPSQVDIVVDVPDALTVSGDRQRLQQVIFNLVGNALDALEGAGEIRIAARPDPGTHDVVIDIHDNGHGIPPEILPRIFDPFFTTKEVGHGLGLGLFIVHEIIEEHGGRISVTSTPGAGTQFHIRLPAQEHNS